MVIFYVNDNQFKCCLEEKKLHRGRQFIVPEMRKFGKMQSATPVNRSVHLFLFTSHTRCPFECVLDDIIILESKK